MDIAGAFGAAKAGMPFDPIVFLKKPQVALRLVSLLFSIIVFGCISSGGREMDYCIFNGDSNACGYGVGIGVIAFIGAILFLVVDAMFEKISSVQHRKYAVMADMGFSGFWTFLWFVGFCYLTHTWRVTKVSILDEKEVPGWKRSNARAAIAFSFFSIIIWAGIAFFAVQRYRLGAQGAFSTSDQIEEQVAQQQQPQPGMGGVGTQPYGAYPGTDSADLGGYQQPPFGAPGTGAVDGMGGTGAMNADLGMGSNQYQPPTY